jgi:chlorite dismutase
VRLPDGLWFPNLIRVNSAGDSLLFDGLNWDVLFEFNDYKRFSTTVEELKIQDPKKQH